MNKTTSFEPSLSVVSTIREFIFGADPSRLKFHAEHHERIRAHTGKHLLGAAEVEVYLSTVDGAMWTGPVYMGRFTPMDVVYDTGSDWLVVEDDRCESCQGNTFDADSTGIQIGRNITDRAYGSAYLTGTEYIDTVCMNVAQCIEDYEYFAIFT